jgi:hypothetical protein
LCLALLLGAFLLVTDGVTGPSAGTTVAKADELTFKVRSNYRYKVQIEFYSQDRNHAWPGGDRAYPINDDEVHNYSLNCRSGEKICYGAWVTGNDSKYWGVGANNKHGCKGCCYTCGRGDTPIINLNP